MLLIWNKLNYMYVKLNLEFSESHKLPNSNKLERKNNTRGILLQKW